MGHGFKRMETDSKLTARHHERCEDEALERTERHVDAVAGIRRGLAQATRGLGRPVDDVFRDLERER